MGDTTGLTSQEAASKREAERIEAEGRAAAIPGAKGPLSDLAAALQAQLADPRTGKLSVGKLAFVGSAGVIGVVLGSVTGPAGMAIAAVVSVIAATLGSKALFSLFDTTPSNGYQKQVIPPTLPKPVGLTPTPDFNLTAGTAKIPATDDTKNPMPEKDLREVERLRRKAESESPINNEDNRRLRELVTQHQIKADQWEVNLRSTRAHFTHYNTKVYPALEKSLKAAYGEEVLHMIPKAPLHPAIYPAVGDKPEHDALSDALEHYGEKMMARKKFGQKWDELSEKEKIQAKNEWHYTKNDKGETVERDVVGKRNLVHNYAKDKARQQEESREAMLEKLNNTYFHNIGRSVGLSSDYKGLLFKFMIKDTRTAGEYFNPFDESRYAQLVTALDKAGELYLKDKRAGLEKLAVILEADRDMFEDGYQDHINCCIEGGKAYGVLKKYDAYLNDCLYPNIEKLKKFAQYDLPEYNKQVQMFHEKMQAAEKTKVLYIGERTTRLADTGAYGTYTTHAFHDAREPKARSFKVVVDQLNIVSGSADTYDVSLDGRSSPFTVKLDRKDDTLLRANASVEEKTAFTLMLAGKAEEMLQAESKAADVHILRRETVDKAARDAKEAELVEMRDRMKAEGKKSGKSEDASSDEAWAAYEKAKKAWIASHPVQEITYVRDTRDLGKPMDVEIRITSHTGDTYSVKEFDVRFNGKGDWVKVVFPQTQTGLGERGVEQQKKSAKAIIDKAKDIVKSRTVSSTPAGDKAIQAAAQPANDSMLASFIPESVKKQAMDAVSAQFSAAVPAVLDFTKGLIAANLPFIPASLLGATRSAA